jgi:hypothetical protein
MNLTNQHRKILLITPDYMEYTSIIRRGIAEYLQAEVSIITTTGKEFAFKYESFLHRLQNFFSKLLLNRNLKKIFYYRVMNEKLETIFKENPSFDDILVLRPDLIVAHLPWIKKHGHRFIAYYWDSFARFPAGKNTIPFFDRFFSFEPQDVKEYRLLFLPNFFYDDEPEQKDSITSFDLAYIASYDKRFSTLQRILASLEPVNLKTNIRILAPAHVVAKNKNKTKIHWLHDPLPRHEAIKIISNSKTLLDIAQPGQEGLSFRIFEALYSGKKIITTNRAVAQYDFYNSQNFFVWQDEGLIPPVDFFTTPYRPIPKAIIEKYSLENWIKQIFDNYPERGYHAEAEHGF